VFSREEILEEFDEAASDWHVVPRNISFKTKLAAEVQRTKGEVSYPITLAHVDAWVASVGKVPAIRSLCSCGQSMELREGCKQWIHIGACVAK
jgi:hypothetical protein